MRIASGTTDQYIYFVALDGTTGARKTGLSSFTVYRSRDGAAAAAYTTPTINETDATNMPGVYELLLDEDMTIASGNDSEEMVFHITATGMLPVTRAIELYRPKITAGETLTVGSGIASADVVKWLGTAPATPTVAGVPEVDVTHVAGSATTATLDTIKGDTAAILTDTAEIGAAGAGLTVLATAANLATTDGKVDAIKAKTDNLPSAPADESALEALIAALPTANENADALLDRTAGVETGFTPRQVLRLIAAVLLGKASGMDSTTAVFRDLNDTKDRVSATVDWFGNRSAVTRDAS